MRFRWGMSAIPVRASNVGGTSAGSLPQAPLGSFAMSSTREEEHRGSEVALGTRPSGVWR